MTLFGDPTVKFGGQVVGGIKISHLSHIDKRLTLSLTASKGKRAPFTVEPLADAPERVRGPNIQTNPTQPTATNPNTELLAEIGALADKTEGGRKSVAAAWAETHEGEHLRDATDLGGLELLADDLRSRAGA